MGNLIFFFSPGIVHALHLFCEGHETRRQACLLLKESMFVTNMFEKPFKNNSPPTFFSQSNCFVRQPGPLKWGYQSCTCGLWKIKLTRDISSIWTFLETIQLLVLWGLRKFQVHVRSLHFSCCFCSHAGPLYHFSQDTVQPNSKRLYSVFVDPLGLLNGTSHKLLRGTDYGRWVGKGELCSGSGLSYSKS